MKDFPGETFPSVHEGFPEYGQACFFNLCFQGKTGKGTFNEKEVPCSEWEAAENSNFLKDNKKEKFANILP
jgi:hypothetical protein